MKISKKEEYLKNKDKKLMRIIELNGHIKFKPNKDNQFNILAEIVISQFISTLAANSIISKIKKYFNTDHLKEEHFQELSIEDIKNLGLSLNKARSLKELSDLFINKQFQNLADLDRDIFLKKIAFLHWENNELDSFENKKYLCNLLEKSNPLNNNNNN